MLTLVGHFENILSWTTFLLFKNAGLDRKALIFAEKKSPEVTENLAKDIHNKYFALVLYLVVVDIMKENFNDMLRHRNCS